MNYKIISVDARLKSKIKTLMDLSTDEVKCFMIKFKDLDDAFFFDNDVEIQEFMNQQVRERFLQKELKKGYFDYKNEQKELLRYYVVSKRGTLNLLNEECIVSE